MILGSSSTGKHNWILWSLGKITAGIFVGVFLLAASGASVFLGWKLLVYVVSPDIEKFVNQKAPLSTFVLDSEGNRLYEYYEDYKREEVPLEKISPHLVNATVAVEDKSFYEHKGLFLPGIIRAAILDIYYGEALHGGSTITQQLVKNVVLVNDKSIRRKIAEVVWSVELEKRLTKKEILERYLNLVPYGRNSAGAEAGSRNFFGVPASDLTPQQAAMLAALPKSPSTLSPDGKNRKELEKRQDYILELMLELGFIEKEELLKSRQEPTVVIPYSDPITAPHFVFFALKETKKIIGEKEFSTGGLVIQTTLNPSYQKSAEKNVLEFIDANDKRYNSYNAGLVSIDPKTGKILAYVGSKNYFGSSYPDSCKSGKSCLFDPKQDVVRSPRQTGSSFKPYVYVTAFGPEFKMTPSSKIADIPRSFRAAGGSVYSPRNYSGTSYGWITTRKALAGSLNVPAVNLLAQIGMQPVIDTVKNLGITADFSRCGLSMALGACEMTLLEHTAAISGLINIGLFNPYTSINKISDSNDNELYSYKPTPKQAVHEAASFELLDIMTDNDARSYIFGKKNPLAFDTRKVAAKTGTTQNWKDAWTVGGTPQIVTGLWVGNNNGQVLRAGSDSIVAAAPLWRKYMDDVFLSLPVEDFREPFGISRVAIDSKTGKPIKPKPGQKIKLEPVADYALKVEAPKLPVPKVAGARKPVINKDGKPIESTIILEPWANQTITKTPFDVKIYTGTTSQEANVKLYLDGKLIEEKTSAPFLFTIQHPLENGWHTLEAVTTHFDTFENKHTIRFRTHFNPPPIVPRGNTPKP